MRDRRRWLIWGLSGSGAILAALGLWWGISRWSAPVPGDDEPVKASGETALDQAAGTTDAGTVDVSPDQDIARGTTPMAERAAVIGLLNKRNGVARELSLKPGQAVRVGNAVVRLRACEQTAPWENDHYTGAFVQLDVLRTDQKWHRVFSGWLYKERPSLNVVLDPVYDVWPKSCAMSFPAGGAATVRVAAPSNPSSAKKSADAAESDDGAAPAPAPAPSPSAPSTAPSTAAESSPR